MDIENVYMRVTATSTFISR